MDPIGGDTFESLRSSLRAWLRQRGEGTHAMLQPEQVRLLLQEWGRLEQSSERLRRQNRRVRLRLQRAGLEPEADTDAGAGESVP
jgi:hypothetical protein